MPKKIKLKIHIYFEKKTKNFLLFSKKNYIKEFE